MKKIILLGVLLLLMLTGCNRGIIYPAETPTAEPTAIPTEAPTIIPTQIPTTTPTIIPTQIPTATPTIIPTQIPTQTPTIIPTVAPTEEPIYVVDFGTEESYVESDYKYGIKLVTITVNNFLVYSDGTKEIYDTYTYDTYDYSGYAATDDELLEESDAIADLNLQYYYEVLTLVNAIRTEAGVHPLVLDKTLCRAATMRAVEMGYARSMSHTRPNGTDCFTVFDTFAIEYCSAGENIAFGYPTADDVVNGWKNSPGHYANMIDECFHKLGVGFCKLQSGSREYWVQLFTD